MIAEDKKLQGVVFYSFAIYIVGTLNPLYRRSDDTMVKLCFDYGHGGRDPGACYLGRKESDDVLSLGMELASFLRNRGIVVDETRTTDRTVGLWERVRFENKENYDFFISFHRNAYRPEVATGAETFTYLRARPEAYGLASSIQSALAKIGFRNRGVKRGNFYVLRNTRAPALLVEIGFLDNTKDNGLFDSKRKEIVQGLGEAILAHFML